MKFQIVAGALCLDFINTLDNRPTPERRKELLLSYVDLVDWATQAGAISAALRSQLLREAEVRPQDAAAVRAKAIDLRECLYRIMHSIVRNRRAAAQDIEQFSADLGVAFSQVQLKPAPAGRAYRLEWDSGDLGLDSILWPIVRSASSLLTSPDLGYVHECSDATCRWVFVDRSKNHSRRWCDMNVCGNRMKARKFYRRQKSAR